jgi:hypothetical protein
MRQLIKLLAFLILSGGNLLEPALLSAQQSAPQPIPTPTRPARKPILMKWETIGAVQYYFSGGKVSGGKGLEPILFPLRDPEATRLLKKSEDDEAAGTLGLAGGSIVLIGGLAADGVYYQTHSTGSDPGALIVAAAGFVVDYVSLFILADSNAEKFNAVQRYNLVVRGGNDLSWNGPPAQSKPQLQLSWKF